jgi:cysteinyl-tRNA synthetase
LTLFLYNTRTRRKEAFEPIEPGHVRMYTCGPTVYAPQHVGNMRSQFFADLLKRTLLGEGWRVTHVINVTDVGHLTQDDSDAGEDKMEAAARETGRGAAEIAEQYTRQWLEDRTRLGCLPPEVLCKATDHIDDQIALVEILEARGYTYRIEDGVYFDVSKFPRYAEFARLDLAAEAEGARISPVVGKRNPSDFALWKFAEAGVVRQQEWDSPFGRGFPGWHVECSAMSRHFLGDHFDIHTGGVDHIKVHHTNEIAQSECAFAEAPWVNVWMHNEFLTFGGEKISKSKGHLLLVQDLVDEGIEPLACRYFFLQAVYRQQQAFTLEAVRAAAVGYRRLLGHAAELAAAAQGQEPDPDRMAPQRERFLQAMRDDLNSPRALAVAWEVARGEDLSPADRRALLLDFDAWLGLDLAHAAAAEEAVEADPRIDALVADREAAREARDFARADAIRDTLAAEGVRIEDTPEGPRWKRS